MNTVRFSRASQRSSKMRLTMRQSTTLQARCERVEQRSDAGAVGHRAEEVRNLGKVEPLPASGVCTGSHRHPGTVASEPYLRV